MVHLARHRQLRNISASIAAVSAAAFFHNLAGSQVVEAFSLPSSSVRTVIIASSDSKRHWSLQSKLDNSENGSNTNPTIISKTKIDNNAILDRRKSMGLISSAVLTGFLMANTDTAKAYEKTFPVELDMTGADLRTPRQKYMEEKKPKPSPLETNPFDLGLGAFLWGSALWFLTGSRSNPLATPLANAVYDSNEEQWLKDRNEGLFAALPAPLLLLLGVLFCFFGFGVHLGAIYFADGSVANSLQLAGVLLINGLALEIGRIASGEKKQTRTDFDRDSMLEDEFEEFAAKRLTLGGNVHRSEVVSAFRRFHAKYRQADNPDNPDYNLNDLEIEQLLKQWNEKNARAQRSSAGFYTGIQINTEADITLSR